MCLMKKISVLPNVITAFGLFCGLFVIFKMSMVATEHVSENVLGAAAGILLLGALADLLDGAVARVMKAESEFGGIFDSLADAVTFGVAPSVVVLKSLSLSPGGIMPFLATSGGMIFSVCGILRLARYNVLASQSKENPQLSAGFDKNFVGLPIPAGAMAIVSMNLLLLSKDFQALCDLSQQQRLWILFFTQIALGYFMISRWKFLSIKSLRFGLASFRIVFATVISAVFLFYGLLHHFAMVFFLFAWLYIIIAWCLSIARIIAGKRSNTLEDFEIDDSDVDVV
jgi:CDP-diacylglycerol--serine O-phosphatidyltransferase